MIRPRPEDSVAGTPHVPSRAGNGVTGTSDIFLQKPYTSFALARKVWAVLDSGA